MNKTIQYIIGAIILINLFLIGSRKLFGADGVSKEDAQTLFAQAEYQEFVDNTSNNVEKYDDLVYRRGLAYLKLGEFDLALESFLTSYKVLKSTVNVAMMKSLGLFLKEDYPSVESTIKPVKSQNFFELSAIHLLGGINYYHMGNVGASSIWINDSIKGDPISPIAYHYLGRIALDQKKRAQAKEHFKRATDQGYATRTQDLFLAQAHIELEELEDAGFILEDFPRDQIDVLPDPATYYLTQAKLAEKKEERATSLAFYNKVLESDSQNQLLYTLVGKMYLDQGDSQKALDIFQKGYDYDQTNTNILVDQYVAFASSDIDDPKIKKELFSKILDESGINQTKYDYGAKTFYNEGLYTESHVIADRLLTINPNHSGGKNVKRNILAQDILRSLRFKESVDNKFEEAFNQFPDDIYLLNLLSVIQANEGNSDLAWETYNIIGSTEAGYPFSEVVASQISYDLLEARIGVQEKISEFVVLKQEDVEQNIRNHLLEEPFIDQIDLPRKDDETTDAFDARLQAEYERAYAERKKKTPVIDKDSSAKHTLLLQWLFAGHIDNQRDYTSQAALAEIDFRFAEDDFIKSQAHAVLGKPYTRLVPFYDHVDSLFLKEE